MSMVWWREVKWLIGTTLIGWAFKLMQEELTDIALITFGKLLLSLRVNDESFNTVKTRGESR